MRAGAPKPATALHHHTVHELAIRLTAFTKLGREHARLDNVIHLLRPAPTGAPAVTGTFAVGKIAAAGEGMAGAGIDPVAAAARPGPAGAATTTRTTAIVGRAGRTTIAARRSMARIAAPIASLGFPGLVAPVAPPAFAARYAGLFAPVAAPVFTGLAACVSGPITAMAVLQRLTDHVGGELVRRNVGIGMENFRLKITK